MNKDNTLGTQDIVQLRQEAKYLYYCLFYRAPSEVIISHYLDAHAQISELQPQAFNYNGEQQYTLKTIITNNLNAVAIEPWFRNCRPRHLLSSKLLLLAYIAESNGDHKEFSRQSKGGWMDLIYSSLNSGFQLLQGIYLKFRYGLV